MKNLFFYILLFTTIYSNSMSFFRQLFRLKEYKKIEISIESLKRNFPDKVLQRYKEDFSKTNEYDEWIKAETIKNEWIKYVFLSVHSKKNVPMFSKEVDDFWHTFLLFTQEYDTFCKHLPEKFHHIPYGKSQGCPNECQYREKLDFINSYNKLYGINPNPNVWKALAPCSQDCMISIVNKQITERVEENKLQKDTSHITAASTAALTIFLMADHVSHSYDNDNSDKEDKESNGDNGTSYGSSCGGYGGGYCGDSTSRGGGTSYGSSCGSYSGDSDSSGDSSCDGGTGSSCSGSSCGGGGCGGGGSN